MPESLLRRRPRRSRVAAGAVGFAGFLRQETTGGKLLLAATAIALLWADVAQDSFAPALAGSLRRGAPARRPARRLR